MGMSLLDLIFPSRCVGCGRVGEYICARCRHTILPRASMCPECDRQAVDGMTHPSCQKKYGLDGLTTVFHNQGVIKKAIKQLKYRFVSHEAETLVSLVLKDTVESILRINTNSVLYPVPLHAQRLKWRGFNQSEKLAHYLSKKFKIVQIDGLLIRNAHRTPQADIHGREDRVQNAHGIFSWSEKNNAINRKNIILVDDIWTTGATMKEAAKVLKRNGVKRVWGYALAR